MVRKRYRRRRSRDEDQDPLAGTTNLVDAMLVISVGLLIFLIMSWNMQSIVFSDMSEEEREQTIENMKKLSEVSQGDDLDENPETSSSSGQGFTEIGKVYKDPETGKMIVVEE